MAERVWLDWSAPALPAAADWLVDAGIAEAHATTPACDLQSTLVVVPGRRAGRLLLHALAARCQQRGAPLLPPRIVTPAPMVDLLVGAADPPAAAGQLECVLAWLAALRAAAPASFSALMPVPPGPEDAAGWYGVARLLHSLHAELAGDRLTFREVADAADLLALDTESERWHALDDLARAARSILRSAGLDDPHERRERAVSAGVAAPRTRVVLVGVVDLNRLQRAALSLHEDATTALVHAPAHLAERFDSLGCLRPDTWIEPPIDVADDLIVVAERPEDQAEAVVRVIAGLPEGPDGPLSAEDIVVGLGDESLAEAVMRAGHWVDVPLRPGAGRPLERTGPQRLLETLADTSADAQFSDLAALVRHPDVERWLREVETRGNGTGQPSLFARDWPTQLDAYAAAHLPLGYDDACRSGHARAASLTALRDMMASVLKPWTAAPAPLAHWSETALRVLGTVYGALPADDGETAAACLALRDALRPFAEAPAALQPSLDGRAALRLLLAASAEQPLPAELEPGQIEMLGWLELHLDPAPALVVAGFNDGAIPQAVHADPFLPDSLRRQLGLMHNDRRCARDAYLLQSILASRRAVRLIAGRRSAEGDLLTPSRLLLACERDHLPARIERLCGESDERGQPLVHAWPLPLGAPRARDRSEFVVPPLPPLPPVTSMRVTQFRDYLQCPYRFALKHLVGLERVADGATEMDPGQFGSLAHDVLADFGREPAIRDSADGPAIAAFLAQRLRERVRSCFGRRPPPAVTVQVTRLGHRLEGFARFQARHRAAGWRLVHCEVKLPEGAALDMGDTGDEPPMPIRGRIDRIDRHEGNGRWLILDYKTAEEARTPEQAHGVREGQEGRGSSPPPPPAGVPLPLAGAGRGGGSSRSGAATRWLDVQLPLYWHLARTLDVRGDVTPGYITLPRDPQEVRLLLARWSPQTLRDGVDAARQVVRAIRAGRFDMSESFASGNDPFAWTCRTLAFVGAEPARPDGAVPP